MSDLPKEIGDALDKLEEIQVMLDMVPLGFLRTQLEEARAEDYPGKAALVEDLRQANTRRADAETQLEEARAALRLVRESYRPCEDMVREALVAVDAALTEGRGRFDGNEALRIANRALTEGKEG